MANWHRSSTREPPKTKAELRQMLTEAVRNTRKPDEDPKRLAKTEEIADQAACVD